MVGKYSEAEQQTGLANARIADQQQLEQIVTIQHSRIPFHMRKRNEKMNLAQQIP